MLKQLFAAAVFCVAGTAVNASTINNNYVSFIIDASGSLGSAGYAAEKSFVTTVINNFLSPTDVLGLTVFSNGIKYQRDFVQDQTRSEITNAVDNLSHFGGTTHTKTALERSISMFTSQAVGTGRRIAVLLTDGKPYPAASQNPCALEPQLISNDIELFIIASGNSNPNALGLECLLDNPNSNGDIFGISDFGAVAGVFEPTPVPLPASLPLMLAGLGLFGLVRRRKG